MTQQEFDDLINKLTELTNQGKIVWETTMEKDRYKTSFGMGMSVEIFKQQAVPMFYSFRLTTAGQNDVTITSRDNFPTYPGIFPPIFPQMNTHNANSVNKYSVMSSLFYAVEQQMGARNSVVKNVMDELNKL